MSNYVHPSEIPDDIRRQLEDKRREKLGQEEGNTEVNKLNKNLSLVPKMSSSNIYEIIEMPPINYMGATYEISIWTNFQQEANRIFETILKSYTINVSQQFRLDSDKPYWFSGFVNSQISTDTSYSDMTENERYVKMNLTLTANGYVILPNMMGGKTALRSFISAPKISFDVYQDESAVLPLHGLGGPIDNTFDSHVFDDLQAEDDPMPSSNIGIDSMNNQINLLINKPGYIAQNDIRNPNKTNITKYGVYDISRKKGEVAYKGLAAQNILLNFSNK